MKLLLLSPTGQSVIPYGTTAPSTIPNVSGPVSPFGWSINFFDDFTSLSVNEGAQTCTTGAMYPYGSNTEAVYVTNEGGESNIWDASALSQSGSIISFNASWNGGDPISGSLNSINFMGNGSGNPVIQTGYWEAKIKFPNGANGSSDGFWGAWWIDAWNNWPPEMDIIEQNSAFPTTMNSTCHYNNTGSTSSSISTGAEFEQMALPNGGSILTDYHIYGGLITPNYLAWYCDGILMAQTAPGWQGIAANSSGNLTHLFINPDNNGMAFILDFAIGSAESGQNAVEAQFPASMEVDWVRYSLLGPES